MRATLVCLLLTVLAAPAAAQTTLAEASAAAKAKTQANPDAWPLSTNIATPVRRPEPVLEPDAAVAVEPVPPATALEQMRATAHDLFATRLAAVKTTMDAHAANVYKYARACADKTTTFEPVFVGWALVAPVAHNETTPECRKIGAELTMQVNSVETERLAILETARAKSIYPGITRALLAGIGLSD